MNEADLQALILMIAKAVRSEDSFVKVYGTIVPFLSALAGGLITVAGQLFVAHKQRAHERMSAQEDSEEKAQRAESELKMWNIASQRKAWGKVAQMRQVWINNLRKEGALYLTLWQEIAYRWDAMLADASSGELTPAEKDRRFESFVSALPQLRKDALEARLRIQLRLNPAEEESKTLLRHMLSLEDTVRLFNREVSTHNPNHVAAAFKAKHAETASALQVILAAEWKVVKKELGVIAAGTLPPTSVGDRSEAGAQ